MIRAAKQTTLSERLSELQRPVISRNDTVSDLAREDMSPDAVGPEAAPAEPNCIVRFSGSEGDTSVQTDPSAWAGPAAAAAEEAAALVLNRLGQADAFRLLELITIAGLELVHRTLPALSRS
jgi:hypothetical protein